MYAGVDLAWGQRARTGVALVDDSGTLVASTSVHTDAQIKDFLAPHAATLATRGRRRAAHRHQRDRPATV